MVGKITEMTSGSTFQLTDRLEIARDPTGTPLTRYVDGTMMRTLFGVTFQSKPSEGAFADGDKTKLDGIEASADVTDAANVTAAGALMDSEVTNLAQVKAFDTTDYATAAQGSTADTAVQPGDAVTTLDGTAHRVLYVDGSGDVTELAFGASGTFLKSNGATSAPGFDTPAGGGDVTAGASITDNAIVRGDGGAKGVQDTGITIDDNDVIVLPSQAAPAYAAGQLFYNSDIETMSFHNDEADIRHDFSRELLVRCRNSSGATISKGDVVYVSGSHSGTGLPEISLAQADALSTANASGVATHDIENNTIGYFVSAGVLDGLTTSAFSNGDELWLDASTAGAYTATRPSQPNFTVPVGFVTKAAGGTGGSIHVSMSGGIKFGAFTQHAIAFGGSDGFIKENTGFLFNTSTSLLTLPGNISIGSTTFSGLASVAETDTATSAQKAVTPDGLAGSVYGQEVVTVCLFDDSEDVATGDGAGDQLLRIPSKLDGWNLVEVAAYTQTAGTTGTTDIQIHNVTAAADVLSTKLTIDSGETDTSTAATAAVIDGAEDDVATGDKYRFDVDAVSTTAPKGLWVELTFQAP